MLPKICNQRTKEIWRYLKKIKWDDKNVIDLGAGRGDIAFRIAENGGYVTCYENDFANYQSLKERSLGIDGQMILINDDIERLYARGIKGNYDIGLCLSTLPYLSHPGDLLGWMYYYCDISIIECQYYNDGIGEKLHILNDDDMAEWLNNIGWDKVEKIGQSLTNLDIYRSIWKCE